MIETVTNLDYLISPLQLQYGDIGGTLYSEAVYRTALVNGVRYLSKKWNGKYYIDSDNNVQRNPDVTFAETTPLVEYQDQYAIVLAAVVILRGLRLTSSASSFVNWQTPDLSVSSGSQERAYTKLYEQSIKDLDSYFKLRLGKSLKRFLYSTDLTYPVPLDLQ